MASATPKSGADIQGLEYDWLGSDESGCVALFSTAGAGYAPEAFLRDTDAHDIAIQAVLALPASTEAKFFPALAPEVVNTWRLVAERGLYAYDYDPVGGPYCLVAAPAVPVRADALPAVVADVVARLGGALRFEAHTFITDEMLSDARDVE